MFCHNLKTAIAATIEHYLDLLRCVRGWQVIPLGNLYTQSALQTGAVEQTSVDVHHRILNDYEFVAQLRLMLGTHPKISAVRLTPLLFDIRIRHAIALPLITFSR
ncbi:hypothetical protein D3C76_1302740 [compost metagenome]